MYSRPRLSRKSAPCPSTITIGSCSGAHHSGMLVKGCQTNCLSAAVNSSVFQLLMLFLKRSPERREPASSFALWLWHSPLGCGANGHLARFFPALIGQDARSPTGWKPVLRIGEASSFIEFPEPFLAPTKVPLPLLAGGDTFSR